MKIQAILFTLLQAQTVLSYGVTQRQTSVADCSVPCKTQLRLSASKMKRCLETNCETYNTDRSSQSEFDAEDAEEDNDADFSGNPTACEARCKRLRFSPARQDRCIADCDEDNSSNKRSNLDADEAEEDNDADFSGNPTACEARCKISKRLRFSPARQDRCIADCDNEDNSSNKRSNFDADEAEEDSDANFRGNPVDCEARCKRLRFSPARQDRCIADCDEDDSSNKRSNFDADEEEEDNDADFPGNPTACEARCKRLRFSPARQDRCIADCGLDDSFRQKYIAGEDSDTEFPDNHNACIARCNKLRFSADRQAGCNDKCKDEYVHEDYASYTATV